MESLNNIDNFLEMIDRPAFFVQDGIITKLNQIAKNRYIKVGAKIEKMHIYTNPRRANGKAKALSSELDKAFIFPVM